MVQVLYITEFYDLEDIYKFQMEFDFPYFFITDFKNWKKSFTKDIDGEGRVLFKELCVKAVCDDDEMLGFIQYGRTAFGFDENGDISDKISYAVIRNLFFKEGRADAGQLLLNTALKSFSEEKMIYAFFHYFGMSCFARHGKLFIKQPHIPELLTGNGFEIEHENVYYSSLISRKTETEVSIKPCNITKGCQQYLEFILDNCQVGGCEVHYVDSCLAYLRWIYVNGDIVNRGIGTKCMSALKNFLFEKGIIRLDTDTALNNLVAQHYYEKNGFDRDGITRSYYRNPNK